MLTSTDITAMAPRRSARPTANPKPVEPAMGKTKVTKKSTSKTKVTKKSTNKKTTTQQPPVKEEKRITTTIKVKTFPCACSATCNFSLLERNLRLVLGRPEFNENPSIQCACKVHFHCANRWAAAHIELPSLLPCGCPITQRGMDFWFAAVAGRRAELMDKQREEEKERVKMAMQKRKLEIWGEDFDSGSDLTDLED
jgi:hypothetical protein